jgi:hypothetical protein
MTHRIYTASFASVYPRYVAKAEKKGRTKAEVDEIICWLTGTQPEEPRRCAGEQNQLRGFLRASAENEPVTVADQGCGLRCAR